MLIDAGDNHKEQFMVDYLTAQGITKVDVLIGTHPHADHIGGMDAVIEHFDIGSVYMPRYQTNTRTFEQVLLAIQNKGLKIQTARAGIEIPWEDDVQVNMVAPVGDYREANEMSAVVRVTYGENSFLFTGDAEAKSEADLLESGAELSADMLLAGHHGSNTSTGDAFLDRVNPSYAVIQSGEGNNYGHPHREVIRRLEERGIVILRNDESGHIIITSDGKTLQVDIPDSKEDAAPFSQK